MALFFPRNADANANTMVFVDGENLAIRYGALLKERQALPASHIIYEPDVFVWSVALNNVCVRQKVVRKYYYTCAQGDAERLQALNDKLRAAHIEAPYVFKKDKRKGSKRVDIQLAVDMLTQASRKSYQTVVLIAGDEDYVPLVEAVKLEGPLVVVWSVKSGLSDSLRRSADYYADIGEILFAPDINPLWR
jgi:uncharacterized LabA/DUF88 family protein